MAGEGKRGDNKVGSRQLPGITYKTEFDAGMLVNPPYCTTPLLDHHKVGIHRGLELCRWPRCSRTYVQEGVILEARHSRYTYVGANLNS